MTFNISLIFLFIFGCLSLQAQDTLTSGERVRENLSPAENFNTAIYRNPAVKFVARRFSLSELSAGGAYGSSEEAVIGQLGQGKKSFDFQASSYIHLQNNSRVWGGAHYKKGRREDVQGNETSDFTLLYPYVMADTLGGDMHFEEYFFSGGYVRKWNRMTWGVYVAYRALAEYRQVDPRPKNTVSDLHVSTGLTVASGSKYAVGMAGYAGKYKQDHQVTFFSELGAVKVYHMTGLAMDYTRFSGNKTSVFYAGYSWGGSVELVPSDKSGLSISAAYNCFTVEKILKEVNSMPLNDLLEHSFDTEFSWMKRDQKRFFGVKLDFGYRKRTGRENLYGEAVNSVYVPMGIVGQFGLKRGDLTASGIYGNSRADVFSWFISPRIQIGEVEVVYREPYRKIETARVAGGIHVLLSAQLRRSTLHFIADAEYSDVPDSKLQLSELPERNWAGNILLSNFRYLSVEQLKLNLAVRWDYALPGNKGLFVCADWKQERYAWCMSTREIRGNIGFVF